MAEQTFGTFAKNGKTRTAFRPHDAVYLQADGWRPIDESVPVPPKAGAGSSSEAWHGFAEAQQVPVDPKAPRAEIIAAVKDAGIPTD